MIPKKVHYCWFGKNKKPELVLNCISSWKKKLPDYEFYEWNETNFRIDNNQFVKEAYFAGKYAFVSDFVRLWALYNYGGIYLDSDIEVVKSLDGFLKYPAFGGFSSSYEINNNVEIPSAVMGAEKGNVWISFLLEYYTNRRFVLSDGTYDTVTNAKIITDMSKNLFVPNNKKQTMKMGNVELFPMEYFEPINIVSGINIMSKNSHCIHWHNCSWSKDNSSFAKLKKSIIKCSQKCLGIKFYNYINKLRKKFIKIKFR